MRGGRLGRPRESGRAERCVGLFVLNLKLFVFQKEVRADVFVRQLANREAQREGALG